MAEQTLTLKLISILGHLIFNIFINDIFHVIKQGNLYNYEDDNTLSFIHMSLNIFKEILQGESILLIQWFTQNLMKANPDKFQAICIGQKHMMSFLLFN